MSFETLGAVLDWHNALMIPAEEASVGIGMTIGFLFLWWLVWEGVPVLEWLIDNFFKLLGFHKK